MSRAGRTLEAGRTHTHTRTRTRTRTHTQSSLRHSHTTQKHTSLLLHSHPLPSTHTKGVCVCVYTDHISLCLPEVQHDERHVDYLDHRTALLLWKPCSSAYVPVVNR